MSESPLEAYLAGILRAGSSTAAQADFKAADDVDAALVTAYVHRAVEQYPHKS